MKMTGLVTDFNLEARRLKEQMDLLDMDNAMASFRVWWPEEKGKWYHTCYNHVCGISEMRSVLPGSLSGRSMPDVLGSFDDLKGTVHENVLADGGRDLKGDFTTLKEDETIAALFVGDKANLASKKHAFHCCDVRVAEDFSGVVFTHKPGSNPAEKLDGADDMFGYAKNNKYELLGYYALPLNLK